MQGNRLFGFARHSLRSLRVFQRRQGSPRSGKAEGEEKQALSRSIKEGGDQIEYGDQDPRIHPDWLAEMKKNGAKVDPKMLKYFPEKSAAE